MRDDKVKVPATTPPRWLNAMMKLMLKTPGLQRRLGRHIALITFTGRRSGRQYATPISYAWTGDTVTALTRKNRPWWRNFSAAPNVQLRLAGKTMPARAKATVGDLATLQTLIEFLEARPRDAKAYGVPLRPDGKLPEADATALLPEVVLLSFTLEDGAQGRGGARSLVASKP